MNIKKTQFIKWFLFLPIASLLACSIGENSFITPTPIVEPQISVEEILNHSQTVMLDTKTVKFQISHSNGFTEIMDGIFLTNAQGEFVNPDAVSIIFDGEMSNGFYIKSGFKIVQDEVFMLNPFRENEWELLPPNMNPFDEMDPIDSIGEVIENLQNIRSFNYDPNTQQYNVFGDIKTNFVAPIFGLNGLLDQSTNIELKIDSNHFYINQVRLIGPIGNRDPEDIVREIIFSNYNEPLLIEVP